MATQHSQLGNVSHRGTKEQQAKKKTMGRQCTFVYSNRENGRTRRCKRSTGLNYFFCKEHAEEVTSYGMDGM